MKKIVFLFVMFGIVACGSDDSRSCTNCSSDQTTTFQVCKESDGKASVNGEGTGVNYETYLDDLIAAGSECGG